MGSSQRAIGRAVLLATVGLLTARHSEGQGHHVSFAGDAQIGGELLVHYQGDPSKAVIVAASIDLRDDAILTPLGPFHLAAPFVVLHKGPVLVRELTFSIAVPDDPGLIGSYVHAEVLASPRPPSRLATPKPPTAGLTTIGESSLARTTIVDRGTDFSKRFDVLVLNGAGARIGLSQQIPVPHAFRTRSRPSLVGQARTCGSVRCCRSSPRLATRLMCEHEAGHRGWT